MSFFNYTSVGGAQFSDELREGQTNVSVFDYPGGPASPIIDVIRADGQEPQGIYPVVEVDKARPDPYYVAADPAFTLSFSGAEYQVGATVQKTYQWQSQTLEQIAARKNDEGADYADTVAFSSAQTEQNPNVWIITRMLNLQFYFAASMFLAGRHKDRTLGRDSSVVPPVIPDATTYWTRNIPVRLINSSNGNILKVNATETDWGQVAKEIGTHLFDTLDALDAYELDVTTKYDAAVASGTQADRDALAALDPTDQIYGWPPFYEPAVGFSRVSRQGDGA